MHPFNPIFAIIIFLIAIFTAYLIRLKYKMNYSKSRNESIDGMRGFLAVAVFIHHAFIWHQFLQSGSWEPPSSNLYAQLGQTSVSLFFMITSFLFISKLLNDGEKGFNWKSFFLSRVFRIVPMYLFSILLITVSVMIISNWQITTKFSSFLGSVFHWIIFTIDEKPVINNVENMVLINAGVEWSLPYEWLFYFSLPLVSIFLLKVKPKGKYVVLSLLSIIAFYFAHGIKYYTIYPFIGGAVAPLLLRYKVFNIKFDSIVVSIVILLCLFSIFYFNNGLTLRMILISIVFTCIAMGSTVFGLLRNSTLKLLGEISYSTYLLHGLVLFTIFNFGIGLENLKQWTPTEYCLAVFSITPLVIIVSVLGFKYIEEPFMNKSKLIIKKLNPPKHTSPMEREESNPEADIIHIIKYPKRATLVQREEVNEN